MKAEIGVVIPAYNAEGYITQALDSIAAQARRPDQTTVVDDGSTDETREIVRAWMQGHPELNVALLENHPNRGISATRNQGIAATPTEFIATLDADDLFLPSHLERLVGPLQQEPNAVLAFGDCIEFTDSEGDSETSFHNRGAPRLRALQSEDREGYRVLGGGVFQSLLPGNYIPVSGSLYRRDIAITVGMYDPGLRRVEDRDFLMRMAYQGRFAYVPEVICRKRIHPGNVSGPEHHLRMAEGAFGVLIRARRWLDGDAAEDRAAVEKELKRAAGDLLYSASVSGLDSLARTVGTLRRAGLGSIALSARAWARAAWYETKHLKSKKY